jgi:hypothetical protein
MENASSWCLHLDDPILKEAEQTGVRRRNGNPSGLTENQQAICMLSQSFEHTDRIVKRCKGVRYF